MATNTETINKIAVSVARIEERMIRYEDTSIELTKAIKGNGKPGLLDRVQVIENYHATEAQAKKEVKEQKVKWFDRGWAIVMLFLAQGVVWLFLILRG